jgi:hypothetical protein
MVLPVQARFVKRISGLLTAPNVTEAIVARWQSYLLQIDGSLASQVRDTQAECGLFERRCKRSKVHSLIKFCLGRYADTEVICYYRFSLE